MRWLSLIVLCFALAACATAREPVRGSSDVSSVADAAGKPTYLIGPRDQLQVSVYGQPDLSKLYTVTAEGDLSLPLAGRVHAAGLSVVQLEQELTRRFAEYLVNPQVTVAMQQFRQRFAVLGEVQKPGSYPLEKRTTVLEAVSIAGGLTAKAAPNRTRVIRNTDGREATLEVPVGDIMEGDQSKDIQLEPNDKVVVPESFF